LPCTPDLPTRAQDDVLVAQPGQLREAQTGLGQGDEQGVVPPADPGIQVGAGDEGADLGLAEIGNHPAPCPLLRDGEHPGDELGVLRLPVGGEAEERVQGGQAGVAGPHAVAPGVLEVFQVSMT
jgi:hypothetical protein